MEASTSECRWRFVEGNDDAWETSCDQWCIESAGTPDRHGFRNGFQFCPYCGGALVLVPRKRYEIEACVFEETPS